MISAANTSCTAHRNVTIMCMVLRPTPQGVHGSPRAQPLYKRIPSLQSDFLYLTDRSISSYFVIARLCSGLHAALITRRLWVRFPPLLPTRIWHIGCAPVFQTGKKSSILLFRSTHSTKDYDRVFLVTATTQFKKPE